MNYIGKNFTRRYDVTSGPIDRKLNYSFIASNYVTSKLEGNWMIFAEIKNMTLLVYFYIAQILREPEVVRLSVYDIKKTLAFVSSFQSTNFHSNWIIGCKDIAV